MIDLNTFIGFRVFRGEDGTTQLAQIVEGSVYPLEPLPEDLHRPLGYYDLDWKYLHAEHPPNAVSPGLEAGNT